MGATQQPTERPLTQRALEALNDGELSTWLRHAQFQWVQSRRLSWTRWQWRRASLRAMREFSDRARRHTGASPALCDRCQQRPPTTHWAYGEGVALRVGHFCDVCRRAEAPGWFATSAANDRHLDPPANVR